MSRIDRIRLPAPARPASRPEADPNQSGATATAGLPVPVSPVTTVRSFREERRRTDAELAAQLMGQDGQRRGLRAGPSMADQARAAYNRVEWSGSFDRRARAGRQTRTDI